MRHLERQRCQCRSASHRRAGWSVDALVRCSMGMPLAPPCGESALALSPSCLFCLLALNGHFLGPCPIRTIPMVVSSGADHRCTHLAHASPACRGDAAFPFSFDRQCLHLFCSGSFLSVEPPPRSRSIVSTPSALTPRHGRRLHRDASSPLCHIRCCCMISSNRARSGTHKVNCRRLVVPIIPEPCSVVHS